MKRISSMKLFLFGMLILCSIITALSVRDVSQITKFFDSSIEALAFYNEGPGPQGQRQPQAVWCGGGGWVVRQGCCYGSTDCTFIYCDINIFSCDGNTWIHY